MIALPLICTEAPDFIHARVLQSFSSKVFTGGRSPLVLAVSVRFWELKESHLEAA
jgi:hypothetical protein